MYDLLSKKISVVNSLRVICEKIFIQLLALAIIIYLIPNSISQQISDWGLAALEFIVLVSIFTLICKIAKFKPSKLLITLIVMVLFLVVIPEAEPTSFSDWISGTSILIAYIVGLILIYRRILIGHLVILYIVYSNLALTYAVFNAFYSVYFFIHFPNLILYNFTNMMIAALAIIDFGMIALKYCKPQLFQQTANNVVSGNFFKRHQLDVVLASIIMVFLGAYWLIWSLIK